MNKTLLAGTLLTALAVSGCSNASDDGGGAGKESTTPSTSKTSTAPRDLVISPAELKKWRTDLAMDSFDWADQVVEVVATELWLEVRTTLYPDAEGEAAAKPICGAYSTISADYPSVEVVRVAAQDGTRLAMCGPGA